MWTGDASVVDSLPPTLPFPVRLLRTARVLLEDQLVGPTDSSSQVDAVEGHRQVYAGLLTNQGDKSVGPHMAFKKRSIWSCTASQVAAPSL